jgi:hypothetical protein
MPSDEVDPMKYLVTAMPIVPLTDPAVLGNLADWMREQQAGRQPCDGLRPTPRVIRQSHRAATGPGRWPMGLPARPGGESAQQPYSWSIKRLAG